MFKLTLANSKYIIFLAYELLIRRTYRRNLGVEKNYAFCPAFAVRSYLNKK